MQKEAFEALSGVPTFQTYVQKVMARELQQENVRGKKVKGHAKDDGKKTTNSPKTDRGRINSPSDTTLYSPALRQVNEDLTDIPRILFDQTGMTSDKVGVLNSEAKQSKANPEDFNASASIQEISNQISKFIEGIRLQNEHLAWVSSDDQPGTSGANRESHDDAQSERVKQMEEAKRKLTNLSLMLNISELQWIRRQVGYKIR